MQPRIQFLSHVRSGEEKQRCLESRLGKQTPYTHGLFVQGPKQEDGKHANTLAVNCHVKDKEKVWNIKKL